MTAADWKERDSNIEKSPRLRALKIQMATENNLEHQYHQLQSLLQYSFRDRYKKTKEMGEWDAEKVYEKKHNSHKLFPQYIQAKRDGDHKLQIHISNEMCRSAWQEFLTSASTGDLRRIFHYFAKKDGRAQPFYKPSCLDPLLVDGQLVVQPQKKQKPWHDTLQPNCRRRVKQQGKARTKYEWP